MLFGALRARDLLLDRGESVGGLPGAAQSFCHPGRDEPEAGVPAAIAEFVEAGAQQPQSSNDIAALDDKHSLKAEANGAKKGQCVPCRMVEQHCPVVLRRSQITSQQSERACRVDQSLTQCD